MVAVGLLAGWVAGAACRRIKLPAVVGQILVGMVMGVSALGLFSYQNMKGLSFITIAALAFIGFDIGGELEYSVLREMAGSIFWITALQAVLTAVLVSGAVYLYSGRLYESLIFGAVASTTAPVTTAAVLREEKACGPLTTTTFAAVGFGDALAIALYAAAVLYGKVHLSHGAAGNWQAVGGPLWEMLGALALGILLGLVFLFLARKRTAKAQLLPATVALVGAAAALSYALNLSVVLATTALGITVVNLTAWKREDVFKMVRKVTPPLYIIFFVLAGARMDLRLLGTVGGLVAIFIAARAAGKLGGSYLGGIVSDTPPLVRKYLGFCLLPYGPLAIALAAQTAVELGGSVGLGLEARLITVVAIAAVFFQLVGATLARHAIISCGESGGGTFIEAAKGQ
jgi:Kef-type K+ transport system membrane component KefB